MTPSTPTPPDHTDLSELRKVTSKASQGTPNSSKQLDEILMRYWVKAESLAGEMAKRRVEPEVTVSLYEKAFSEAKAALIKWATTLAEEVIGPDEFQFDDKHRANAASSNDLAIQRALKRDNLRAEQRKRLAELAPQKESE